MSYKQENKIIQDHSENIVQFATSYEQNMKTSTNQQIQQQSEYSSSSQSIVSKSVYLLSNQIICRKSKCEQIIKIPNLLHSIVKLCNFQQNVHSNKEQDELAFELRGQCRNFLKTVQQQDNLQVHVELMNIDYIGVLITAFSTAGGIGEQSDYEIYWRLHYVSYFFKNFQHGRNNLSFHTQIIHIKTCQEQIEKDGGNEELVSQLINKGNGTGLKYDNIIFNANQTKDMILNRYIDLINRRQF